MVASSGPVSLKSPTDTPDATSDDLPGQTPLWELGIGRHLNATRWIGWRLRLLVMAALLGCTALFLLIRALTLEPHIDAQWHPNAQGRIELVASGQPSLRHLAGRVLDALVDPQDRVVPLDALALQHSPRWLVDDAERARQTLVHASLLQALERDEVRLQFTDGTVVAVPSRPRGAAGTGALFWLLCGLSLVLYLMGMVVLLARPSFRNALYTLITLAQSGSILLIAVESIPGLTMPIGLLHWDVPLRLGFDLVTAAAVVHATTLHPRVLPRGPWVAAVVWMAVIAVLWLVLKDWLPWVWWWAQGSMLALGLLAIGLLTWGHRRHPHPLALVLRRFGSVAVATLALLTFAIMLVESMPGAQHQVALVGSVIWYVFLASLLLMLPFLSRSQQLMREFSLLAGISTVATSLDLLFVAVFSLGQFASLTLSLFLALGVYAGARQWVLNQVMGSRVVTTERMFEQLYRIAREVEAHPELAGDLLARLLRELFDPIEVRHSDIPLTRARVTGDGSALLVPVPQLCSEHPDEAAGAVVIRYAQRGKRLFTLEDARLTDRIVEQLKRAVAFDKAVEQGRNEERVRLAQDLHDDIGARLLTLMYKAPNQEMEDYVRHTLQDLKTLTRGLAASNHRLSHAAAEWKADITQRLTAAHCELGWSFGIDRDLTLSVVQWSAITRLLRELVTNAIAHAQATHVEIEAVLENGRFTLTVSDNGIGRNPQAWSHGLGLGGIRKRVKQLGGDVEWRESSPCGIQCLIVIPHLSDRG